MSIGVRKKCIQEQYAMIVEFFEKNPIIPLNRGIISDDFTFKDKQRLWSELSEDLNQVDGGAKKSVDKWQKCWSDYKTEVKKKFYKINKQNDGTEPVTVPKCQSTPKELTSLEKRVLSLSEMQNLPLKDGSRQFPMILSLEADGQETAIPDLFTCFKQEYESDSESQHPIPQATASEPSTPKPSITQSSTSLPSTLQPSTLQPRKAQTSSPEQTAPKSTSNGYPNPQSPLHGILSSSEHTQSLVEAQEATAVCLSQIADQMKRKNDLSEQRLQVEKRKACAFEAIAEYYRNKTQRL